MWQRSRQLLSMRGLTRATGLPLCGDPGDSEMVCALVTAPLCWWYGRERDAALGPVCSYQARFSEKKQDAGGKKGVGGSWCDAVYQDGTWARLGPLFSSKYRTCNFPSTAVPITLRHRGYKQWWSLVLRAPDLILPLTPYYWQRPLLKFKSGTLTWNASTFTELSSLSP